MSFDSQGEPAAYICFVWPLLNRWQGIAAYESHRPLVTAARDITLTARLEHGDSPSEVTIAGDAANALAEMTLRQLDDPMMGGFLMYISEAMAMKYMFATCRAVRRGSEAGSSIDLIRMGGVTNLQEARAWADRHPLVAAAKLGLLAGLKR